MPTNPFVSLFGRSPIGPMQQHMAKAHECAAQLVPFFQAVIAEDWERVEQLQKDMARMENEADKLKKGEPVADPDRITRAFVQADKK